MRGLLAVMRNGRPLLLIPIFTLGVLSTLGSSGGGSNVEVEGCIPFVNIGPDCPSPPPPPPPDTATPTIIAVSPTNGAVDVLLNTSSITVSFSEHIDRATLNQSTFTLRTGSTRVSGTVIAKGTSARFSPSADLLPNTVYTATVTTGVKDTSGNALASDYSWAFTTGTAIGWAHTYESGVANAIQETAGGGYVVAGRADSDHWAAWVLSLDALGDIRWEKVYDTSSSEYANAIQQTQDGGYIVAGSLSDSTLSSSDVWVLKLDADGDIVWQKAYDGNRSVCGTTNMHRAYSVQQTVEGGYIVMGSVDSCGHPSLWVLKLDDTGNVLWQKSYGPEAGGSSIQQTADGGYVVAGGIHSATTFANLWVLKLDRIGNIIWQKTYAGTSDGGPAGETGYAIHQTMDGGYVVSGVTYPEAWVLRLDASGAIIWQKAYGGNGATSVQQTADGGYVVAGDGFWTTNSDFWVFRLDASGNVLWQKAYGDTSYNVTSSLELTADGGYVLAGTNFESSPITMKSTMVIKLPADGLSETVFLKDTNVLPRTTDAVASDTSAIPTDTEAVVTDTAAEARPR